MKGITLADKRKLVGLALSGGGVAGTAHIGVLKALEDAQVPVDIIAGTSAGSIIASLYAAGWSPSQMEEEARSLTKDKLFDYAFSLWDAASVLADLGLRYLGMKFPLGKIPSGIIRGDKLARLVEKWTKGLSFNQTSIPLAVVATDLHRGERVLYSHRNLVRQVAAGYRTETPWFKPLKAGGDVPIWRAVRASVAIPGLFLPYSIGGRVLVDGGVVDNVPVDVLQMMGAQVLVAVNVGFSGGTAAALTSATDIAFRAVQIMGHEITQHKLGLAQVIIRPAIGGVSLTSLDRIPHCIEKGEKAGREAVPFIKRLLAETA
jgi:NTE family protein